MEEKTINNNFMYHEPKEGQPALYESIRDQAKQLAILIQATVPE